MNWPIARRITVALIALTMTAVVTVSTFGIARETEGIRNLSLATLRIIARKSAKSLDQLARTAQAQTATLANSLSVVDLCRGKTAPRVLRYFETRLENDPDIARIMVVDANSRIQAAVPAGNPAGWPEVYKTTLERTLQGEAVVSGLMRRGVIVANPVRDSDGTVIGAVMLQLDRGKIREMIADVRVGNAGFAIIEERLPSGARIVVSHPNPEREMRSRDSLTAEQLADARARWHRDIELFQLDFWEADGDTFLTGQMGEELYGASADTKLLPWTVHVLLPRGEFDESIGALVQREIGTVMIVLLLACLVAWWQSRSILRPVRALTQAAEKIAEGDLDARADIRTDDELGRLATVFDRMVPQLAETLQLKQSLEIAGAVQDELLPKESPEFSGLDVYGAAAPYEQIGGDFFDFLDLRPWDDDRLAVVIGDVVGHGIAAAMLMATARAHVRSRAQPMPDLGTLFNDINARLGPDLGDEQFMTMAVYVFDAAHGRIDWCSAGHDAAFHFRSATGEVEERALRNLPIGVMDDWEYKAGSRDDFLVGDTLLIGTDGIWEARNKDGEEFGKERVRELLRKLHDQPSRTIVDAVFDAVTLFRGDLPRQDDLTLVAIRRV